MLSAVSLPDPVQTRTVLWTIFAPETAEYHRPYLHSELREKYSPLVRTGLETGQFVPATEYIHAQRVRQRIIAEVRAALADIDALLIPGTPFPAYPLDPGAQDTLFGGETKIETLLELKTRYTALFNLTGQPALVVPCGFSANGLPISLQVVGRPFDDALVLRVARAYERATDWHTRRPPV
jgi:aspartyl-tRNA(Asn)/glutamyl-tRNA(Gln) amidotransferase subunit A